MFKDLKNLYIKYMRINIQIKTDFNFKKIVKIFTKMYTKRYYLNNLKLFFQKSHLTNYYDEIRKVFLETISRGIKVVLDFYVNRAMAYYRIVLLCSFRLSLIGSHQAAYN